MVLAWIITGGERAELGHEVRRQSYGAAGVEMSDSM